MSAPHPRGWLLGHRHVLDVLAKYGAPWNWAKGAKLAKRVWGLLDDLVGGVRGMWKHSKAVDKAKNALAAAKEKARKAKNKDGSKPGEKCETSNSFLPGTKVLIADGSAKPIEDVKIGDKVLATDPETEGTRVETVTAEIIGSGTKHLVKVTVDLDGERGERTASVTATDGHPFWVPELGEWLDATDLQPGQWLQTSSGTWVQITAVKRWTAHATVHNLTVSDLHTYYVLAGATPVLVHNCNKNQGVYVFDDKSKPGHVYIGKTNNFNVRLNKHADLGRRDKDWACHLHPCVRRRHGSKNPRAHHEGSVRKNGL
ncbi:hypothetical protein GCM10010405_30550 [Streptomyces macrosporus]|uniref:Hint domain-containing protein n=1 Tax=Streptomyces macrosporus TaxID=44032 RepID=A0ABN3K381_9ACTN